MRLLSTYGPLTLVLLFAYSYSSHTEAAVPWQISFQDPATPVMEGIINLHHDVMIVLIGIGVFVGYLMIRSIQLFFCVNYIDLSGVKLCYRRKTTNY